MTQETPQQIIVVRRRRTNHEEAHHGGVWKIAYADFMTAMMAFFLVMWLINSTDEKTIVQVAAYFNPMRLSDKTPSAKGLHEGTINAPEPHEEGASGGPGEDEVSHDKKPKAQKKESKRDAKKHAESERELFSDPTKSLAALVAAAQIEPNVDAVGSPHSKTGDAMPEPFDHRVRKQSVKVGKIDTNAPEAATSTTPTSDAAPALRQIGSASDTVAEGLLTPMSIATELRATVAALNGIGPQIDVHATTEGILISLSDASNFGMFEIASAKPKPQLVRLMEQVAAILQRSTATVIVRGHTDGRPFRNATYDNWRLSSARAQMAFYMLVRSGLSESRIERIEGYADHKPKNAADPNASENRRIDILLRADVP